MKINSSLFIFAAVLLVGVLIGYKVSDLPQFSKNSSKILTPTDVQAKIQDYLTKNNITGVTVAKIEESDTPNIYKVSIEAQGQTFYSYVTTDGSKFFQSAWDLNAQPQAAAAKTPTEVTKADKPTVELFVMSHCPYGTQIEKGILPVKQALGDKIDFEIKFVDYAMHGEKEVREEMNQYCIQSEQGNRFDSYLTCFLEAADTEGCLTQAGINKTTLSSCVSKVDEEFKIMSMYNDKSTWSGGQYPQFNIYKTENDKYGVQGSPTLVINETQVSGGRDSASLLTAVCNAFNEKPEECNTELSSEPPSAGFGAGTASETSDDAQCN